MISIFGALLPVFGLVALGMVIDRVKMMPQNTALVLNQWVFRLSLPSLIFVSFAVKTPEELTRTAYMAGSLLGMIAAFIAVYAAFKLFYRHSRVESGIWSLLASFPNTSFLGLPILASVFPGNNDVILASAISTVLSLPLIMLVTVFLEYEKACSEETACACAALRKVSVSMGKNPVLLSTVAGVLVCMFRVPIPGPLTTLFQMISITTSPCSLVAIGMVLAAQIALRDASSRTSKSRLAYVNIMKLLVQPIITYILLRIMGESGPWLAMGVILAAMPTGTIVYVVSENYNSCTNESSLTILTNTLLSVLTIPLTIMGLEYLNVF